MGRHQEFPLSDELLDNLGRLLVALNKLRAAYKQPMAVSSGYRPGHFNKDAGGAKGSHHLTLLACDFSDPKDRLDTWCRNNLMSLKGWGLYLEHPDYTPGWCHLQIVAPTSGKTMFTP